MIRLGRYNRLIAFRETEYGWYLTDEDQSEEVLLPNKFVPKDIEQDQEIEVFIFNDSEDRATATTQKPTIELDSFGYLKVFDSSNFGAFMDMGLDRQLLVPFSEQRNRLEVGEWYIIFMYLDGETDRLVGSNKWMNYVEVEDIDLEKYKDINLDIPVDSKSIIIGYKAKEIAKELHKIRRETTKKLIAEELAADDSFVIFQRQLHTAQQMVNETLRKSVP